MNYNNDYTDYLYEVSREISGEDDTLFELNVELYREQSELPEHLTHNSLESVPVFSGIELFTKVIDKYIIKRIESNSRLSFLKSCITDYLLLVELNGENATMMSILAFEVYDLQEQYLGFMVQGLSHEEFYYIEGSKELQEELYFMRGLTANEREDDWIVDFYQKLSNQFNGKNKKYRRFDNDEIKKEE